MFWTVTVPLARPALLAGVVLAWARALSEFGATMMFAGNFPGRTQTLPLAVMTAMESDPGHRGSPSPSFSRLLRCSWPSAMRVLIMSCSERAAAADALHAEIGIARGAFQMDISLRIGPGETLTLVGPSGSGKSTAVAAIAGLLALDRGRILFGEEMWCDPQRQIDRPSHERKVGLVHQDFALFPHLTVRGNVMYGPRSRGSSRAGAASEADRWLERLGLGTFSSRSAYRALRRTATARRAGESFGLGSAHPAAG